MPLKLDFDAAIGHIKAHYYAALQYPTLYRSGVAWYFIAHADLRHMANRHRTTLEVTAAITAVLSPNNKWTRNLIDADNCLNVAATGGGAVDVKCGTYGENKVKAFRILQDEHHDTVLGGNKVKSFFQNLVNPYDKYTVTVDGHALAVALGARILLSKTPTMTDRQYNLVGDAYRQACKEINADRLVGQELLPSQVQAVCWVYYRFLHNLS